jgi:hypothetical protein
MPASGQSGAMRRRQPAQPTAQSYTTRQFPQRAHYKTDVRYRIAVIAWVFVHPECVCPNGACDGSCGSSTSKEMAKFSYIPCALGHPASLYRFLHERLPCIGEISETEFWQLLGGLGPHSTGISVGDSVLGDNQAQKSCFHFENPCEDKTTRSVLEDTNVKRRVRAFTKVRLLRPEVRADLLNLQWNLDYALVRPTLLTHARRLLITQRCRL